MSGFFSDEEWAEICRVEEAKEEAEIELREERIAIQIHDGGLSEEEALRLSATCIRTSTVQDNQPSDNHDSNMTHFSRHNSGGIQEEFGATGNSGIHGGYVANSVCVAATTLLPSQLIDHCACAGDDVVKADGCDIHLHGKSAMPEVGDFLPTQGNAATEDWSCLTSDGKIAAARGDLLIDNVAGVLINHFDVAATAARALAHGFITLCQNLSIRDPLKFLTEELAIKWLMCNAGGTQYVNAGKWICNEARFYAKYNILDDAPKTHAAQPKKTNWAAIRQAIINCGRVGGDSMRGADLSDYVAHIQGTTRRFDPEVSHALGALGAAGLIERRSGGISVRAEVLQIPAEKKNRISTEKAMDYLREVVERCYPDTQDWRATVDSLFPFMRFWRQQTNPDAILGLADQIERMGR